MNTPKKKASPSDARAQAIRTESQTIMLIEEPRAATKSSKSSTASSEQKPVTYRLDPPDQMHSGTLRVCLRYTNASVDHGNTTANAVKIALKDIKGMDGKASYVIKPGDPEDDKANQMMCVYLEDFGS